MARIKLGKMIDLMLHFEGQKFYKAALILKDNPVHYTNIPCWVNLAFSIELMLKSLEVEKNLITSKKHPSKVNEVEVIHPTGHKLDVVFNSLSDTLRTTLSHLFLEKYKLDIEQILSDHSSLFEDARYLYPRSGKIQGATGFGVNEAALFSVAEFLASMVQLNGNN